MPSRPVIKRWIKDYEKSRARLKALRREALALARRSRSLRQRISQTLQKKNKKVFRALFLIKRNPTTGKLFAERLVSGTSTTTGRKASWTFEWDFTWPEDCGAGCDQAMAGAADSPEYPGGEVWCTCECSQQTMPNGDIHTVALVECNEI